MGTAPRSLFESVASKQRSYAKLLGALGSLCCVHPSCALYCLEASTGLIFLAYSSSWLATRMCSDACLCTAKPMFGAECQERHAAFASHLKGALDFCIGAGYEKAQPML